MTYKNEIYFSNINSTIHYFPIFFMENIALVIIYENTLIGKDKSGNIIESIDFKREDLINVFYPNICECYTSCIKLTIKNDYLKLRMLPKNLKTLIVMDTRKNISNELFHNPIFINLKNIKCDKLDISQCEKFSFYGNIFVTKNISKKCDLNLLKDKRIYFRDEEYIGKETSSTDEIIEFLESLETGEDLFNELLNY